MVDAETIYKKILKGQYITSGGIKWSGSDSVL